MSSRWVRAAVRLAALTLATSASGADSTGRTVVAGSPGMAAPTPKTRWCAPELTVVTDTVCFHDPEEGSHEHGAAARRTLVIFLHSLIGKGSRWAWDQQRLMIRYADSHGFAALIPQGRPGLGPGRDPNVLAWPTARELQKDHEDALIAEWMAARARVEKETGEFERVLVFGFSNGAYYATNLAVRGRLDVDGYAVFAGGQGGKYHELLAAKAERRVPIFVGYGTKDPDHPRQESLVRSLRKLGWPHRARADRVGHTVTGAQMRDALAFLGHRNVDAGD